MATVAENLQSAIAGYAAALAADAANPLPTVTIDGKTVDRNKWREGIQKQIDALQKTLNAVSPYFVTTRMVL